MAKVNSCTPVLIGNLVYNVINSYSFAHLAPRRKPQLAFTTENAMNVTRKTKDFYHRKGLANNVGIS